MQEVSEGEAWLHFRNSTGLILSCRRYLEDWPDLGKILEVKGTRTVLPKGLAEASDKAGVFSSENKQENQVKVEIKPGKLRIRGQGISGWYQEVKKVTYDGPELSFLIAPELLADIVKRHNDAFSPPNGVGRHSNRYRYIACLIKPTNASPEVQEPVGNGEIATKKKKKVKVKVSHES